MERVPPDPEDGMLPEPVRPPSSPAWSIFTLSLIDDWLEGDPVLSGWEPGEAPLSLKQLTGVC